MIRESAQQDIGVRPGQPRRTSTPVMRDILLREWVCPVKMSVQSVLKEGGAYVHWSFLQIK